jgi:hypothetical protein
MANYSVQSLRAKLSGTKRFKLRPVWQIHVFKMLTRPKHVKLITRNMDIHSAHYTSVAFHISKAMDRLQHTFITNLKSSGSITNLILKNLNR